MTIQLLFFAIARDRAGRSEARLTLPEAATLSDAQAAIIKEYPAIESILPYVRYAVDEAFVLDMNTSLHDGATVAIIPPVAGG